MIPDDAIKHTSFWATQTNKGSLKLSLSSNGNIKETDLKIKQIKPIAASKNKTTHAMTYLSTDENHNRITCVRFNVHGKIEDTKGSGIPPISYMKVTVEIKELARVLGVNEQDIKNAVEAESLDTLITNQLSENILKPEISETTPEKP